MGNFIENTFSGIGNAVSGLFGGRGSGSSRPGVGQQVAEVARQKAIADRYDGDLTEDQMNELRAKSIFNSPNVASGRGMISGMKKGGKVKAYAKGGSTFGRPGDEKTLEGGGGGGGYSSAPYKIPTYKTKDTSAEAVKALGTGATVAGAGALAALASLDRDTSASDEKSAKKRREAAAEYKRETRGGNKFANGGSVSASSRGDGIAQRGKTKGRMC